MWKNNWREVIWSNLDQEWDLIIVGGGITGAGIFQAAAASWLKTLLVDAHDFSFGTSSRSSKLVHGGFRYLYNRQYQVTFESVRQRERLLKEAPQLVSPLAFTLPNYTAYRFPSWMLRCGLAIYDLMGSKWDHQQLSAQAVNGMFPALKSNGLLKGFCYKDAVLDDARLVLRVIKAGVDAGGTALNYARAASLLRDKSGHVCGIALLDTSDGASRSMEVTARAVVNATGPWTDDLRSQLNVPARLRKLRGSHIILSQQRLPLPEALTLFHPRDRRAMFMLPWEGASLVGTTDIDHDTDLDAARAEPFSSTDEISYMLEALEFMFPALHITHSDILSSFSGLRPIINTGAATPSKESRAHQIWNEKGLITITGGKLTTFRLMARQTLRVVFSALNVQPAHPGDSNLQLPLPSLDAQGLDTAVLDYLGGRYGEETAELLSTAGTDELHHIHQLPNLWAELRWAARSEGVVHLDDLLLRRVRLGLLLPQGGREVMPRVRAVAQPELGWDDQRWQAEEARYWDIWQRCYSPDPGK